MTKTVLVAFLCALSLGDALPHHHLNDQVEAGIADGTFANPSANLAQRGAGGIEFLNYYNYGGAQGAAVTDWNLYGFGSPAYRKVLKSALETHNSHGLIMDYSMGPQSGQGVPAAPDDPGLAYNLISYNATINGTYHGQVPGWEMGEMISVVTFAVINSTTVDTSTASDSMASFILPKQSTQYVISSKSLTDVTGLAQQDGSITVATTEADEAVFYLLYPSYSRRSYARACVASTSDPQDILQNGSFAVDHFSVAGAKLTTGFLEHHVLKDGIKELMMQVGNYIFEDSAEIPGYVYWTPDLLNMFRQQHEYCIGKYVPLLSGRNGYLSSDIGPVFFITDDADQGAGYVSDYRSTLSYLLLTYYDYLRQWSNQYLNLQFSGQVDYNLPVDMLQDIPHVNAPEAETLAFSNSVDGMWQYSGPANLAGKRVVSIELGAVLLRAYSQSLADLLFDAKRAFAAGINQVVIHGATYSHTFPMTTWPGFTTFEYAFSGQHSRHQPAWDVGYSEAMDYLARMQYTLQKGVPKSDLVFWDKQTAQGPPRDTLYFLQDLARAGYTYEYLSPENFILDTAYVQDKVLAPTRQEFRALVLRANDTMTANGAHYLAKYARARLPIIISGGLSTTYNTIDSKRTSGAKEALEDILSLPSVHEIGYEPLEVILSSIGVLPRIKICSNGTWFTKWRETSNGDVYAFVYNDGEDSQDTVSF